MTSGIRLWNSSGTLIFDSSRVGGVVIDSFVFTYVGTTPYSETRSYVLPEGRQLSVMALKGNIQNRDDLASVSISNTGSTWVLTIYAGYAVRLNITVIKV